MAASALLLALVREAREIGVLGSSPEERGVEGLVGDASEEPPPLYLDESIGDLSEEIERVIAPFSEQVELLDTIPGVNRRTAETLIAEIGVDMSQFPTHRHLASWA